VVRRCVAGGIAGVEKSCVAGSIAGLGNSRCGARRGAVRRRAVGGGTVVGMRKSHVEDGAWWSAA
jgi:hypothetical protein